MNEFRHSAPTTPTGKPDDPGEDDDHQRDLTGDGRPAEDQLADGARRARNDFPKVAAQRCPEPVEMLDHVRSIQARGSARAAWLLIAQDVVPPPSPEIAESGSPGKHAHGE